jgi:hypothetical protein
MQINKIKMAAEIAKAKTTDKRWLKAIDAAVAGVESGWIVTELVDGCLITTENGTYKANGICSCRAFEFGQACKHRALARLIDIARELPQPTKALITRTVERQYRGDRVVSVKCDGWQI